MILVVYRASRPHVAELGVAPGAPDRYVDLGRHPEAAAVPDVTVLRVESELFFANADTVRDTVRAAACRSGAHTLVLDVEAVSTVDVTAAHMLAELADGLEREGVTLVLARSVGQVRDVLSVAEPDRHPLSVYATVRLAVAATRPAPAPPAGPDP